MRITSMAIQPTIQAEFQPHSSLKLTLVVNNEKRDRVTSGQNPPVTATKLLQVTALVIDISQWQGYVESDSANGRVGSSQSSTSEGVFYMPSSLTGMFLSHSAN